MFRSYLSVFLFFGVVLSCFGQKDLAIGQWAALLPYNKGAMVTQSKERVYYSTGLSIFSISKLTGEVENIEKSDGLSEVGINQLVFDESSQTLVVIYESSSIDLIREDGITNLNDIKANTAIQGDKTIYRARIFDGRLYLCAGFGMVEVNLKDQEFGFTLSLPNAARDVAIFQNRIFMVLDEGLYSVAINSNPPDFTLWRKWGVIDGLPAAFKPTSIAKVGNGLLIGGEGVLLFYDNGQFNVVRQNPGKYVKFTSESNTGTLVGWSCRPSYCQGVVEKYNSSGVKIGENGWDCVFSGDFAIEDESGKVWFADDARGYRSAPSLTSPCSSVQFNSPRTHYSTSIATQGKSIYIAAGGVDNSESYLFREDGLMYTENGTWKELNKFTNQAIALVDIRDFYIVKIKPQSNKVYVGTYYEGLIEKDGDNIKLFNTNNSSLQGSQGDTQRVRVSGMAFDKNRNLWMANFFAPRPISVLKENGQWKSFTANGLTALSQVAIDQQNYKWFVVKGANGGLLVFDEGKDIDSETDDRYRYINQSNSVIPSSYVNCVDVGLDGDVWVGTNQGIAIFECGASVFKEECKGSTRIISQDGVGAILLKEQSIRTIATDGANRKWIGTTNGVFVQSPDGKDPVFRFTAENSPLADNAISTIHIDQESGVVYIGTAKGVCTFRSGATQGKSDFSNDAIYAFPNPVRPGYDGVVAVKGLTRDANVKITDANGELVFETTALGGQMLWDTKDFKGNYVQSGVYMIFCTDIGDLTNITSFMTKLAIVR